LAIDSILILQINKGSNSSAMAIDMKESLKTTNVMGKVIIKQIICPQQYFLGLMLVFY